MPKTSQFDHPIAFDANGEPDLWDSDTIEGRARIQKRIAEARGAEIALSSGSLVARVDAAIAERFKKDSKRRNEQLEGLTEGIAQAFKAEREKFHELFKTVDHALRIKVESTLLDAREELAGMRQEHDRLRRDIEGLIEKRMKLVAGGKDAA